MTDKAALIHLSPGELDNYFLDVLSEDESKDVELHLAACADCTTLALNIQRSWSDLYQEMSPDSWKEEYFKDCLKRGLLCGIEVVTEQLRTRFADWLRLSMGRAEGVVRVVDGGLSAAAESASNLLFPNACFPALTTVPFREAVTTRHSGEASLSSLVLGTRAGPQAIVLLENLELVVRFQKVGKGEAPPLVFLIPTAVPEKTRTIKLDWSNVHKEWIARIKVGPEDFLVVIGPQLDR